MKIAVILSGCGVYDGSEIHEATCTLLNIDKLGAEYQCFAPDISQSTVVNHCSKQSVDTDSRNVLEESARIARGKIKNLSDFNTIDFDAIIFPGGSGAVMNLCNYGTAGNQCQINDEVARTIIDCFESRMPIGAICIAPVLLAQVLGKNGIAITIGNNPKVAAAIEQVGSIHKNCAADDIIVDEKNLIVTTPGYMLAKSIKEVDTGIAKLVTAIIQLGSKHCLD